MDDQKSKSITVNVETPISFNAGSNNIPHYMSTHPYRETDFNVTLAEHNIRFPFTKIIDRSQGKSVCQKCKAVYAGDEIRCKREIRLVSIRPEGDRWGTKEVVTEMYVAGQKLKEEFDKKSNWEVCNISREVCLGNVVWDLSGEFAKQERFFLLLENIRNICRRNDGFEEWKDCFPEWKLSELRSKDVEYKISNLEFENSRHHDVIRIIAEKIDSAGNALSFRG